jgi:hypothetical protein
LFGLVAVLQNVAVISSSQITPVLGSDELFVWPPAPSACCRDCAATGDAAKSNTTMSASFFISLKTSAELKTCDGNDGSRSWAHVRKWQHDKSASMTPIMQDRRHKTGPSKSYARITSARTSFRSCANGARAFGKMPKRGDQSKLR